MGLVVVEVASGGGNCNIFGVVMLGDIGCGRGSGSGSCSVFLM